MYYINELPNESGNHGNPVSNPREGMVALPAELLGDYLAAMGFVFLTVEDGTVTALTINQEAYDAYIAEHPDVPEEDNPTTEDLLNAILGVTDDE